MKNIEKKTWLCKVLYAYSVEERIYTRHMCSRGERPCKGTHKVLCKSARAGEVSPLFSRRMSLYSLSSDCLL